MQSSTFCLRPVLLDGDPDDVEVRRPVGRVRRTRPARPHRRLGGAPAVLGRGPASARGRGGNLVAEGLDGGRVGAGPLLGTGCEGGWFRSEMRAMATKISK